MPKKRHVDRAENLRLITTWTAGQDYFPLPPYFYAGIKLLYLIGMAGAWDLI